MDGNTPIFDDNIKLPIITATASEKIHGTNAAVCYSNPDGFWVQSRKNIITTEKDNAGCAFSVDANKDEWMDIIYKLAKVHSINLDENIISVYFEWAGGNIFSGASALTGIEKSAVIFQHFKVSPIEPTIDINGTEASAVWRETYSLGVGWLNYKDKKIYNIMQYETWSFDIDFNAPQMSQNKFIKVVEETVEPNSPIGKMMGVDGNIGEGIVVTFEYNGNIFKFKVKGEKHSKTNVKTLKPVDEVKEQKKIDFANYAAKGWRLDQMYQETFDTLNGGTGDIKKTGDFLRAVLP